MMVKTKLQVWLDTTGRPQRGVAKELGVTPQCVSLLLLGKSGPSFRLARTIEILTEGVVSMSDGWEHLFKAQRAPKERGRRKNKVEVMAREK